MFFYNSKQHDLKQDTSEKCYPASLALAGHEKPPIESETTLAILKAQKTSNKM